ncbi:unnamed protein product [Linum tenue]|nr:unnamed protein product [Linum tenue]
MCLRLLGQAPTDLGGGVIRITWLREIFDELPLSASPETTEQYARAYALSLMGGVLFSDRSGGSVHLQYLLLVEDWRRAGRFAWGAAVLSYLYREMGRSALQMTASSSLGGDFGGWAALLMLWTWERFPHTSPLHAVTGAQITQDAVSRGIRWLPAQTRQHGDQFYLYKLWFDECTTFVVSI